MWVNTISQRELRNDNAAIMRGVEQGESYTVTRRGVPVGRLVPLATGSDLHCDRPAKKRSEFSSMRRVVIPISTGELLADLRGDR